MDDLFKDNEERNDLTFSREQGYFDKSFGIRLFIGLFFSLCLFTFLHFREIRVEFLELGSRAEKYVVSQVDFNFLDEEANIILKQEAIRDISNIYKIYGKEIKERRTSFERDLVKDQEWRRQAENSTFEEISNVAKSLEDALLEIRFTNPRTLHKRQEVGLPISKYQIFVPFKDVKGVFLPKEVWERLSQIAFLKSGFQEESIDFVLKHFRGQKWTVEEDNSARTSLQHFVEKQVPLKYTRVNAGDRIIDQGETVTSRHLAMMQSMKKSMSASRNLWHPSTLLGTAIITLLSLVIGVVYLWSFHPSIFFSNKKLFLFVTIFVMGLFFSKATEFLLLRTTSNLIEFIRFPLVVPFPAILLCSLMSPGAATFASAFLSIAMISTLAVQHNGFLLINFLSALTAILSTRSLRRRKEIFVVCIKSWFSCVFVVLAFHFYGNTWWGGAVFADLLTTLIFMVVTGVLIVGLLPLLEAGFHIMTDVTLMEYMDPNHHLLRRLAIESPGTYQHSVVVGNLAEAGAIAIGANGLFCRVSTLYHDIGKLTTPHYFTENQEGGVNIHQLLTPLESAQVIISHVSEGVALARKAGLPEQFIDIIKEHHGTTLVYYFYAKQLELTGGDDASPIDERDFRYMGPKPRRKESCIIMIADSIEAASRSLDEVNEQTVTDLVDNIVKTKIEDGQFDNSLLTFEELLLVKRAIVKTLVAVGHSRIKYPKPREKSRNG